MLDGNTVFAGQEALVSCDEVESIWLFLQYFD